MAIILMKTFDTSSNRKVPVEPCLSSPGQFSQASFDGLPPGCPGEDSPTLSIKQAIVNTIRPYSENTQKEALREMMNRLQRELNHG